MPNANGGLCAAFLCAGPAQGNDVFEIWYREYYPLSQNSELQGVVPVFDQESAVVFPSQGGRDGMHIVVTAYVNGQPMFLNAFFGCPENMYEDLSTSSRLFSACSSQGCASLELFADVCKSCPTFSYTNGGTQIQASSLGYGRTGGKALYHSVRDCYIPPLMGTFSDGTGSYVIEDNAICSYVP